MLKKWHQLQKLETKEFRNLSSILPNFHRSIENSEILTGKTCRIERSQNEVLTG